MAPVFNTTIVCNTTEACADALDTVQERLDDAYRLSHILASLLGIVCLLFICSPLIFNLPKEKVDFTRSDPPPPGNEGVQMRDLESRAEPNRAEPDEFIIDSEEEDEDGGDEPAHTAQTSQSTLPYPDRFREVKVDGTTFHVARSDSTILTETGVFRGAGDERELAQRCVDGAQPTPAASSPIRSGRSESADVEASPQASPSARIGTAVSVPV